MPDGDLEVACSAAFEGVDDALSFTPETLRDQPFVLYSGVVTRAEIHGRGRDVGEGRADQRMPVSL